jgi:PERQ amino acid-rich with GYF domain-containing protein
VTQNSPGGFNLASPTSRPGTRRRDTSESYPFPSQTGTGRFTRDEVASPPASLIRRRTDYKEAPELEEEKEKPKPDSSHPLNSKRSINAGLNSNGSWGASPATTFSPVGGAFGNFALSPNASEKRPGFGSLRSGSRFKSLMKENDEDAGIYQEQTGLPGQLEEPRGVEETPVRNRGVLTGLGASETTEDSNNLEQQTPRRQEPMSPTDTNPYQSPEEDRHGKIDELSGLRAPLPGLGGFTNDNEALNLLGLSSKPSGFGFSAAEPPQPLILGAMGGLGALPGLGASSAWTANLPAMETPTREKPYGNAFGDGMMASMDAQLQSAGGFGGQGMMGGIGRGSRLPSLLPNSMGDAGQFGGEPFDPFERSRQEIASQMMGQFGGMPMRETDSPLRARAFMEGQVIDGSPAHSTPSNMPVGLVDPGAIGPLRTASGGLRPDSTNSGLFQPPAPQVRQMVMPDRMKWEYKDHSGSTQGPFSGLEMHDWYKAGYFTPELLIKKLEDLDYEPLAQLIRRIGNSREPFLVPQIGIPHSPPPNMRPWAGQQTGGIQPPFANSFPSFGTTLTAEQQNDLERRKQEAQYLMARQKEHLQQHQLMLSKIPSQPPQSHQSFNMFPQQLHHQNSAHSLHSQPSIGSMTGPTSSFATSQMPLAPGMTQPMMPASDAFRGPQQASTMTGPEARLSGLVGQMNLGPSGASSTTGPLGPGQAGSNVSPQVAAMLNERSRMQQEQAEFDAQQQMLLNDPADQITAERLQQFHEMRMEADDQATPIQQLNELVHDEAEEARYADMVDDYDQREQSMTEQVQMAMSQKAAWTRVDPSTMQPILPPPQSISPMPAPVAQRRQNVADTLATASRSANQTPTVETPSSSVAPWAKEVVEAQKGPSLKEIQEVEAKKAAHREEIAAAARRAALEKEVFAVQQAAAQVPQPGLPSTSTWASSSGATPAAAATSSVWGARSGTTARVAPPTPSSKKTLQQIQKEEEARKLRAVATAATASTVPVVGLPALSSGKRYADLAGKAAIGGPAAVGNGLSATGAWTTVGAGGKVKTPIPATVPAALARSISGSVATVTQPVVRPKQTSRSTTLGGSQISQLNKASTADAMEEFRRWAIKELSSHLNKGINGKLHHTSIQLS